MPPVKTTVASDAAVHLRSLERRIGDQVRELRLDAGISQAALADVIGAHPATISRIEAGRAHASVGVLARIGIALGADLGVRYFSGVRPRLRDRFQSLMIETLLASLDGRWRASLEVPVATPNRGVIDIVLDDDRSPTTVCTEAHSQITRLEQVIRWSQEKAAGFAATRAAADPAPVEPTVSRLLLVRSTIDTRALAADFASTLRVAYPARVEEVVAALTTPTAPWPGPGIAWIQIDGPRARLLPGPPRGVALGR